MTTTAPPRALAADVPIPFARLVAVEARKLVDTRAGRWLLIIQAALILGVLVIVAIVAGVQDLTIDFLDITQVAAIIMSLLLPVMGIMVVTSEWSQRTHMATFTLVPDRTRVFAAKAVAVAAAAVASVAVAVITGTILCGVADLAGVAVRWNVDTEMLAGFVVVQLLGLLLGFAFGTLILNTPGAIVAFVAYSMIVPGVFEVAATGIDAFADIRPWLDLANAQAPLVDDGRPLGDVGFAAVHWGQLALTVALWIGVPLVLGLRRVRRADIA